MQTELADVDLGPVLLSAPGAATRLVEASHGYLWQWVGTGEEYVSVSVAVRTTRLGNLDGVRHHLRWEVQQIEESMHGSGPQRSDAVRVSDVLVMVDGSLGSAAADVDGPMRGLATRNRIIVTTDGEHMHVTRAVVRDNEAGRELVERVTESLRVQPWTMPESRR